MSALQDVKLLIVEHVDLAKDALHVYVALVVFIGACWLFRWRPSSIKPWLVVLAVAVIGEIWDYRDTLAREDPVFFEFYIKDLWNTMLAPTILLVTARFTTVFGENPKATETIPDNETPD